MKQIDTELSEALRRLNSMQDFKLFMAWITGSREEQRSASENTQGESRVESCGASRQLSEIISRVKESSASARATGAQ